MKQEPSAIFSFPHYAAGPKASPQSKTKLILHYKSETNFWKTTKQLK